MIFNHIEYCMKIKANTLPIPLASWDLYAMHLDHLFKVMPDMEQLNHLSRQNDWDHEFDFRESLFVDKHVLLVTDIEGRIEYASENIYQMNGYHAHEVVGRPPKIFQGPDTDPETAQRISAAVKEERPFEEIILNYRKTGEKYRCWIKGEPVRNAKGELVNFIAFEKEVA